jgi:hypothetical protein
MPLLSLMVLACADPSMVDEVEAIEEDDALARPAGPAGFRRWFRDADGDGFGDPATGFLARTRPPGHVFNGADCLDVGDDAAATYPGAAYFDAVGSRVCMTDSDGDGFGSMTPARGVTPGLDCEDEDASSWCVRQRQIGNYIEFPRDSTHAADFLLGSAIDVPYVIVLESLALIGKSATGNVKMALYTDNGGEPGSLVVATESTAVPEGVLEIPVEPTVLSGGTYWIMGVYDTTASIGIRYTDTTDIVQYTGFDFSDPIPSSLGTPMTYTGQIFNYYLTGY